MVGSGDTSRLLPLLRPAFEACAPCNKTREHESQIRRLARATSEHRARCSKMDKKGECASRTGRRMRVGFVTYRSAVGVDGGWSWARCRELAQGFEEGPCCMCKRGNSVLMSYDDVWRQLVSRVRSMPKTKRRAPVCRPLALGSHQSRRGRPEYNALFPAARSHRAETTQSFRRRAHILESSESTPIAWPSSPKTGSDPVADGAITCAAWRDWA